MVISGRDSVPKICGESRGVIGAWLRRYRAIESVRYGVGRLGLRSDFEGGRSDNGQLSERSYARVVRSRQCLREWWRMRMYGAAGIVAFAFNPLERKDVETKTVVTAIYLLLYKRWADVCPWNKACVYVGAGVEAQERRATISRKRSERKADNRADSSIVVRRIYVLSFSPWRDTRLVIKCHRSRGESRALCVSSETPCESGVASGKRLRNRSEYAFLRATTLLGVSHELSEEITVAHLKMRLSIEWEKIWKRECSWRSKRWVMGREILENLYVRTVIAAGYIMPAVSRENCSEFALTVG
ncbi:hypothetical protein Tco_0194333 [Tanacetum coccineum]